MPLATGDKLGPFEIVGQLGAGGMGEVYRARDSKLKRDVAIKVLPADVANDRERLARFQREAEVLASLNHPHIAHVYGIEDPSTGSGQAALVMELVEGEDLSRRIARGPISIDEALQIARQIAEALEAAHEAGIVHRDLKPANIKVRDDGTVKVLDFGLAKALDQDLKTSGPQDLVNSPTITSPAMTMRGVILGTAAYMAPEQARGKRVDKRADIWAFGCVLYEMLTAQRLFTGESSAEVIGSVLRQDIDLAKLPAETPPVMRRVLRRCLERDPNQRLHDIADARIELSDRDPTDAAIAAPATSRRAAWLGWAVATGLLIAAGAWLVATNDARTAAPAAFRFTIPLPDGNSEIPAISPDGRHLAYASGRGLLLRALDEAEAHAIDGTDDAREPFWSPDSRSIAFFSGGELKRVAITGGVPQTLASIPQGWPSGTWSTNGAILIEVTESPENEGWFLLSPGSSSLKKIKPFGKDRATNPDKAFPSFLPDGDHFLYTHPVDNVAMLSIGSISSDDTRLLTPADTRAVYASGFLLFVRKGALLAQRFDAASLTLEGEPVALVDEIEFFSPTGEASFAVSQNGTLIFRRREGRSRLRWFERDGRESGTVLDPGYYDSARLSNDGQRIALEINDPKLSTSDMWIAEVDRNAPARLTSSPRSELAPQLSPDGRQVAFAADWRGPPNLYVADVDGGEPRVLVPFDRTVQTVGGWTPDGKQVVYDKRNTTYGVDVWVVDVATGEHQSLLATDFDEQRPSVSPNGEWLAYASNASGRQEVYVREFPKGGWQLRLSVEGGTDPVWRHDGRELFYYERTGSIMAVPISRDTTGRPLAGVPVRLFSLDARTYRTFDVARGGTRFLLNLSDLASLSRPDEVVVDWIRMTRRPN